MGPHVMHPTFLLDAPGFVLPIPTTGPPPWPPHPLPATLPPPANQRQPHHWSPPSVGTRPPVSPTSCAPTSTSPVPRSAVPFPKASLRPAARKRAPPKTKRTGPRRGSLLPIHLGCSASWESASPATRTRSAGTSSSATCRSGAAARPSTARRARCDSFDESLV